MDKFKKKKYIYIQIKYLDDINYGRETEALVTTSL